ncbi:hypothetical protein C8J56DRAFT_1092542 [Mycena floridula]|nr:hypothetical protein C8J56DRAFT_1092542 [Mycena floridula]
MQPHAEYTGINKIFPPEILIRIFFLLFQLQLTREPDRKSDHLLPSRNRAPLSLRAVCRYWHTLTTNFAPFWSTIYVTMSSFSRVVRPQLPLIKLWLQYSQTENIPLLIRIIDRVLEDKKDIPPGLEDALDLLISSSISRWQDISIDTPHIPIPKILDTIPDGQAVMLKRVELHLSQRQASPEFGARLVSKLMSGTEAAQQVVYRNFERPFAAIPIQWGANLTVMALFSVRLTDVEVVALISTTPRLQHLSVETVLGDPHLELAVFHDAPVEFPHLTYLSLSYHTTVEFIFSRITVARLRHLVIYELEREHGMGQATQLILMLERSRCLLNALSLSRFRVPATDIMEILVQVSTLDELLLFDSPNENNNILLAALTVDALNGYLCPQLTLFHWQVYTLGLDPIAVGQSKDGSLGIMLWSRVETWAAKQILRIKVDVPDEWKELHPGDQHMLALLQLENVQLEFASQPYVNVSTFFA